MYADLFCDTINVLYKNKSLMEDSFSGRLGFQCYAECNSESNIPKYVIISLILIVARLEIRQRDFP